MSVVIQSDGVLEAVSDNLEAAPQWWHDVLGMTLPWLGEQVMDVMEGVLEPNRYTGELQSSLVSEYHAELMELTVHPTAERGRHDAGVLLELGTGPIPNAPYVPIAAWAEFRGLPAFPVWWKIRSEGVDAHPFLQRTLDDPQTQAAMLETSRKINVFSIDRAFHVVGRRFV